MSLRIGVLEASGLDFEASSPRFWGLQALILEFPASILKPPGSIVEPPSLLPSFGYASHIQQHNLTNVGQISCLGFLPFLLLPSSKALPKCGRRRCPPLGAFNPPPTEGVQGVLNPNHIAYNQSSRSITNGQAPDGKLKFLL